MIILQASQTLNNSKHSSQMSASGVIEAKVKGQGNFVDTSSIPILDS